MPAFRVTMSKTLKLFRFSAGGEGGWINERSPTHGGNGGTSVLSCRIFGETAKNVSGAKSVDLQDYISAKNALNLTFSPVRVILHMSQFSFN